MSLPLFPSLPRPAAAIALVAACAALSACTTARQAPFQREEFQSSSTYSRGFAAPESGICEAARRALLSQGYVVSSATAEAVNARKSFQPEVESHVEIEIRVVCTADKKSTDTSLAFVSALQDRYALKKSNNSASVGVGAFGSLSVPFTSSDDSMVKVASETITAPVFYDRFFKLMSHFLAADAAAP